MSDLIKLHFPEMEGEHIYHYTSGNGVLGILQKDKIVLQLTKADSVNDTTEGLDIFAHLNEVCGNLLQQGVINQFQHDEIIKLKETPNSELPTSYAGESWVILNRQETDVFVMSFCKDKDSLPMWNYYANYGQQGYCLHFNKKHFEGYVKGFDCHYMFDDVIYSEEDKRHLLETLITNSLKSQDYMLLIADEINLYQYLFKHSAFQYEKETRLIIAVPKETKEPTFNIEFKNSRGYIVPYIEWEITKESYPEKHMFLFDGITISPLANKELENRNMSLFLDKRNYPIASMKIENSQIPIRF